VFPNTSILAAAQEFNGPITFGATKTANLVNTVISVTTTGAVFNFVPSASFRIATLPLCCLATILVRWTFSRHAIKQFRVAAAIAGFNVSPSTTVGIALLNLICLTAHRTSITNQVRGSTFFTHTTAIDAEQVTFA